MVVIKLEFDYPIYLLEIIIIFLYMFVCPICVFQYRTKESEYSVFKITLEFSVEECK